MAFVYLYTKDGTPPATKYYQAAAVTVTKGELLYFAAGYVTNTTYSDCDTNTVAGVAEETKVCSVGNLIPIQVNRSAVYRVGTADTMAQDYVGYNCALASGSKTITSNTNEADSDGVCKIEKYIDADEAEVSINFSDPGA